MLNILLSSCLAPRKTYFGKRYLVRKLQPHHNHPAYPEEQNVIPSFQYLGRIKQFEVPTLINLRPSQRAKGPQAGAEPRVQHVILLGYDVKLAVLFGGDLLGLF